MKIINPHFGVLSLFPEMFQALHYGITGRALEQGLAQLNVWQLRDFADKPHCNVDDRPYGGGPGMVLMAKPLGRAIEYAKTEMTNPVVIYLTPTGKPLSHQILLELLSKRHLLFIAGRYEGIDERIVDRYIDEQYSLGDYVLSGGELAIMVLIDALIRLLPGALGDSESAIQDSFVTGLLDCAHYTRPRNFQGLNVPDVLLSGDHAAIECYRRKQALGRTWRYRPDLLNIQTLSEIDRQLLEEYKKEN